jgi:hypothetical protein
VDLVSRWRLAGLGLLVLTGALVAAVAAGGPEALTVLAVVLGVLGLACLRAGRWVRKARVLTEVGLDLHVPEDPAGQR